MLSRRSQEKDIENIPSRRRTSRWASSPSGSALRAADRRAKTASWSRSVWAYGSGRRKTWTAKGNGDGIPGGGMRIGRREVCGEE